MTISAVENCSHSRAAPVFVSGMSAAPVGSRSAHSERASQVRHRLWRELLGDNFAVSSIGRVDARFLVVLRRRPLRHTGQRALSPRQVQVIELLVQGRSNGEIADMLGARESSVVSHATRALGKLGLPRREQAVVVAAACRGPAGAQAPVAGQGDIVGDRTTLCAQACDASLAELTPALREVALLVAAGSTNAEIASLRRTSPRTVANQVADIFRLLRLTGRGRLTARLLRMAPDEDA